MTDAILACADTVLESGCEHLTVWQVEVNRAVKETGLSFDTGAVLAVPTKNQWGAILRARQRHHVPGPPRQ